MTARLPGLTLALYCALVAGASAADLPELTVPDGLGVNIHFTDPRPGEMAMLAEGGFRWVRMDFAWGGTEREKGQYDFSAYERLMGALEPHGIRALFILDYSNRHYDGGLSPASDEGRKAFARWSAAAAVKFRGKGILWEMYNEPNIQFWKPKPDVEKYILLALEVGRALREAAPEEMYIGPATSQIDLPFLEACFKAGLLEYWSAVSVHPYRQTGPETAAAEYAALRRLIDRYAPPGKKIPILSGEWGYSAAWRNYDPEIQGKMLPRQWLTNLACGVPVSIWYDWHDDGPDPKEAEHHFGTVLHPYREGQTPVYEPKPAYLAARALTTALGGFRYSKRLDVGSPDDYVLLFSRGDDVRLAAWTIGKAHEAVLPASPGRFQVTGHTGQSLPALAADAKGLAVTLADAPQYLAPEQPNDLLRVAAAWEAAPLDLQMKAQARASAKLALRNPLSRPLRVTAADGPAVDIPPGETATLVSRFDLLRNDAPTPVRLGLHVGCVSDPTSPRATDLGEIAQTVLVSASNPLRVSVGPPVGGKLIVRLENPSGEALRGTVRLTDIEGFLPSPVAGEGGERSEPGEGGLKAAPAATAQAAPLTPGPSPATGEGRNVRGLLPSPVAGEGGERSEPGEGGLKAAPAATAQAAPLTPGPSPATGEGSNVAAGFEIAEGATVADIALVCDPPTGPFRFGLRVEDAEGHLLQVVPPVRMRLLDDFSRYTAETLRAAYQIVPDGDAKVGSEQSIDAAPLPPGAPLAGGATLRIRYRMDEGWKFFRLVSQSEKARAIEGRPKAIGFWIHADGSGHSPRLRFVDATGQTFQPTGEPLTWKGWRYVTIPLSGEEAGHWGGADDGVVHAPIRWDSILLIDGNRQPSGPHELLVGSPVVME